MITDKCMKHKVLLGLLSFLFLSPVISFALRAVIDDTAATVADTGKIEERPVLVYTVTIDGTIGAVTGDRINMAVDQAENDNAELLVILLDTPGGFTKPTWAICKNILNSEVPVCMYISPPGARAGSAGVYMTYASHIAAMSPSTNIGAAHPVSGGGEVADSVMNEKITNDAVAQIRAAAEKSGRNADWAEKAVRESVSITANKALELNVIDLVAEDLDDLFEQLDGQEIELPQGTKVLNLKSVRTEEIEPTWVQRILDVITQPDIVLILFSIGGLGIVLELYNPGAILPGVVGAISLILAFYASQTLPINYAGVALIILAIILWVAEVKVISHGLLTVGGIISFFLGGLMLVDTVDPELKVSLSLLITLTVVVGLIVAVVLWLVVRAARRQPFIGKKGMIGKIAEVRRDGFVYVDGALWKAECNEELQIGNKVEIIDMDKLVLKVKRISS